MLKYVRVLLAAAFVTVTVAGQAQAVGLAVSGPVNPTTAGSPFPANGYPSFYQDTNGLALQGCLDNTPLGTIAPLCILPIIQEEDYDFHFPIVYNGGLTADLLAFPNGPAPGPTAGLVPAGACPLVSLGGILGPGCVNYPSETFYYYVSSNPKVPLQIGTGSISLVLMALEGASVSKDGRQLQQSPPLPANSKAIGNPRPVEGLQAIFQRFKILMDNTPVAGNYTFTHPWGSTVFNCPTAGALCKMIVDIPLGTPLNFLSKPDPALGQQTPGSIGPFMVSANPLPPATPAPFITNPAGHVFIGNPTATGTKGMIPGGLAACPTCNIDANGFSFMRIDGPPGSLLTTGNVTEFFIGGQVMNGLQVSPASADAGVIMVGAAAAGKTFTVTNVSGQPANISLVSSNPAFTIPAATDHCSTNNALAVPAPLLPSIPGTNTCTFDVVFTPTANASVSSTISVNGLNLPPVLVTAMGTGDGIAPAVSLAPVTFVNTLTPTISGSVSDLNGVSSVTVSINGGAAQNATLSAGAWTLANAAGVTATGPNNISVTASDIALPAPGNQNTITGGITVDTTPPTVGIDALLSPTTNQTALNITGTASDASGISSVQVKVNGTLQGLATVTAGIAPAPSTWAFTVTSLPANVAAAITAVASDPAGNTTTSLPVSVTFVPPRDGDINMDGVVDISDALMSLRTAVGLANPTAEQRLHGDVFPMDASVPPKPVGDARNDVSDALLILRKVVKLVSF